MSGLRACFEILFPKLPFRKSRNNFETQTKLENIDLTNSTAIVLCKSLTHFAETTDWRLAMCNKVQSIAVFNISVHDRPTYVHPKQLRKFLMHNLFKKFNFSIIGFMGNMYILTKCKQWWHKVIDFVSVRTQLWVIY